MEGVARYLALSLFIALLVIQSETTRASEPESRRLGKRKPAPRNPQTQPDPDFNVRYIFALGTEGTGHRVAESVLQGSPMQEKLKELGLVEAQQAICEVYWHFLVNGCHLEAMPADESNDVIYHDLVTKLSDFNDKLHSVIGSFYRSPDKGTMNVHLNLVNECTVNYPSYNDKTCRDQEYLSLHVFYKACAEAGVDCGHMVLVRNPLDVWRYISKNDMDDPVRIVHTMAAKLDSIASQMASFGNHLVACLDYDDPRKEMALMGGEKNLLGWFIPDGSLNMAFDRIHVGYDKHPEGLKYPEDQALYMEIINISSNLIKNLCAHQLKKRAEKAGIVQLHHS